MRLFWKQTLIPVSRLSSASPDSSSSWVNTSQVLWSFDWLFVDRFQMPVPNMAVLATAWGLPARLSQSFIPLPLPREFLLSFLCPTNVNSVSQREKGWCVVVFGGGIQCKAGESAVIARPLLLSWQGITRWPCTWWQLSFSGIRATQKFCVA